jgi:AcrR family transcriptional regulator
MSNERGRARSERHRQRAERRADGPIWARPEPGARRPRYTREQIAETALAIADAEGIEEVSMRRVASELRAGTMTLYHYVRTKDDLLTLMDDAIMGEVVVPEGEMPEDWREAVATVARRSKEAFNRHPWAFEALQGVRIGPNGMLHFEQTLQAVAGLDIPVEGQFEIVTMVDDYVFGHVGRWGRGELFGDDEVDAALDYITRHLDDGDYPSVRRAMGDGSARELWDRFTRVATADERFERGLQWLLDGIEQALESGKLGKR